MSITITAHRQKNMGVLSGKISAALFDIAREMPGRRRWQDRDLIFELTRANIEFLQEKLPDATWEIDRSATIEQLIQLEADSRAAKTAPLPPEASNFRFKTMPREHQRRAFAMARGRKAYGFFLEQGLGKTKVELDLAADLWASGKITNVLIDAPNNVHAQWIDEQLPIHLPDWVVHKAVIYRSEQPKYLKKQIEDVFAWDGGLRIFAVHHDASVTEKGLAFIRRVLSSGPTLWVIDESSRKIKTPGAIRTKNTLKLRDLAAYRHIDDGTPVHKGVEDLYTQLRFLSDDVHGFSSFYTYRNRYCKTRQVPGAPAGVVEIYGYQNLEEIQRRMDGWTIRMRSQDCLDLPERTYVTRRVEMTPEQKRIYNEIKTDYLTQLDNGVVLTVDQAMTRILRLQQVLCGHIKDEEGELHHIPTNRHKEALAAAEQIGDKVVVWARFHYDIDLLKKTFESFNPVVWDGRRSTDERKAAKSDFIHRPDVGAFIANQGSAGTGVDGLQHASHNAIWYSNTFKANERWQGDARLWRDGQRGTVLNTDLVVPGTVDSKLLTVLQNRTDVAATALDIRSWLE